MKLNPTIVRNTFAIVNAVAGLTTATFITSYPAASFASIALAFAASGFIFNFGYLFFVQDKTA